MSEMQGSDSAWTDEGTRLRLADGPTGQVAVVTLEGDLDVDRRERTGAVFAKALAASPVLVVADVSGVHFCDSGGLNLLLITRQDCEASGCRLVLAGVGPQLGRLLEVTGASEVFEQAGSVAEALGS